jgi:hypothetical protein
MSSDVSKKPENIDIIKAWCDGIAVQYRFGLGDWQDFKPYGADYWCPDSNCVGDPNFQWRIKPDQLMPFFDAD